MSIDTEIVFYEKPLNPDQSVNVYQEAIRHNNEYLENALMYAKDGQSAVVSSVSVKGSRHLPQGASKIQSVGLNLSMLTGNRTFYIFAFPDGSWYSHDHVSKKLTYSGTLFTWNTFLKSFFTQSKVVYG